MEGLIWGKVFANIVNLGVLARKKIFGVKKKLEATSKDLVKDITFANKVGLSTLIGKKIFKTIKISRDIRNSIEDNELVGILVGIID